MADAVSLSSAESRAVEWVERLLQPGLSPEKLLKAALYMEARHYHDVVEERHIELLCGWPMCSNILSDVPTARYHVSLRRRIVLDLTHRKKFCSDQCYKQSQYYSSQLSTQPVSTRNDKFSINIELLKTCLDNE